MRIGHRISISLLWRNKRELRLSVSEMHGTDVLEFHHCVSSAANEQRGIHSLKEVQTPRPPSNISEVRLGSIEVCLYGAEACIVEPQGHVVCEWFQTTGEDSCRCRLCRCWLSVQVRPPNESFEKCVLTLPCRRIFLPRDNQVLTLVLGGESTPLVIFDPQGGDLRVVGATRYPSSKDGSKRVGKG